MSLGCRGIDNPAPPDTAEVESEYVDPTGQLSAGTLRQIARDVAGRIDVLDSTGRFDAVIETWAKVSDEQTELVENPGEVDEGGRPDVLAVVYVDRICRGPVGDDVIDAEANGTVSMTLKASRRGVYRVLWGSFEDCIEHTEGDRPYVIDGDYAIVLGKETELGRDLLVLFRGTITVQDALIRYDGELDFLLRSSGQIEIRVRGQGGDVIIGIDEAGNATARDRNGEWTCDLNALHCESATGEVVDALVAEP